MYRYDYTLQQLVELDAMATERQIDVPPRQGHTLARTYPWWGYGQSFQDHYGHMPPSRDMSQFTMSLAKDPLFYMNQYPDERLIPDIPDIGDVDWWPSDAEMRAVAPPWLNDWYSRR